MNLTKLKSDIGEDSGPQLFMTPFLAVKSWDIQVDQLQHSNRDRRGLETLEKAQK